MTAPALKLEILNCCNSEAPICIAAVPSHLYHITFELFKNSMRATLDRYGEEAKLPDVEVLATLGKEDLSVRIIDKGGGIPQYAIGNLFKYTYTTAPAPSTVGLSSAMAGYGYGLPLSRLYARYFHGDLVLASMEGYGTEAFLYMKASVVICESIHIYEGANENNSISTVCTSNYIGDATCDMVDEKDLEVKNNLVHRSTMRERGIAITVRLTRSSLGQIQIRVKVQTFSHTVIACAIVIVGGIIC